jgi:hypothetical protein
VPSSWNIPENRLVTVPCLIAMVNSKIQHPLEQKPIRPNPINPEPVNFGDNVIIFDPSVSNIQAQTQRVLATQKTNQFGTARTAFFFKPGVYSNLTVEIGYYTTVHGLGALPDDVTISGGGVQSTGLGPDGSALNNFWRGVENLSIMPLNDNQPVTPKNLNINLWAVSQATFMRRVHIKGVLFLADFHFNFTNRNWSSGGFIADSVVDTSIIPLTQQQFLTRNTNVAEFAGGVWNMVFVGDQQQPSEGTWGAPWPSKQPFTVIKKTPVIREKPFLTVGSDGSYSVQVPALAKDTQGPTWSGSQPTASTTIPINKFYIAKPEQNNADNAAKLNEKLQLGYHLILTPGIYPLASSLKVNHPGTCILGIGIATLMPTTNTPAMEIADVDGVSVSGILFDAGPQNSPSLLVVGPQGSNGDHSANPTALFDLSCRVGGAAATAKAQNCFMINSNNVIMDNVWIWRADHGIQNSFVGWDVNPSDNGITVNGNGVTAYGLFVEHFKKYQTMWNGNGGSTYFYQSEIPYDIPSQSVWNQPSGEKGYPSYKVSDNVTTHTARGLGVYSNFQTPGIQLENAISTPSGPHIDMYHMVTVWLDGKTSTSINHVLNGKGNKVSDQTGPQAPAFL